MEFVRKSWSQATRWSSAGTPGRMSASRLRSGPRWQNIVFRNFKEKTSLWVLQFPCPWALSNRKWTRPRQLERNTFWTGWVPSEKKLPLHLPPLYPALWWKVRVCQPWTGNSSSSVPCRCDRSQCRDGDSCLEELEKRGGVRARTSCEGKCVPWGEKCVFNKRWIMNSILLSAGLWEKSKHLKGCSRECVPK